ncbi:hypothetical protein Esti_001363 [Eimeria stiedai]
MYMSLTLGPLNGHRQRSGGPWHTLSIALLVVLMHAVLIASLTVERLGPRPFIQDSVAVKHGDLQAQSRQGPPLQTRPELEHRETPAWLAPKQDHWSNAIPQVASAGERRKSSTAAGEAPNHGAVTHAAISLHSDSSSPPFSYLESDGREQWSPFLWAVIADVLTVVILIATIPFMLSMARGQGWKFWKTEEIPPSRFPTGKLAGKYIGKLMLIVTQAVETIDATQIDDKGGNTPFTECCVMPLRRGFDMDSGCRTQSKAMAMQKHHPQRSTQLEALRNDRHFEGKIL